MVEPGKLKGYSHRRETLSFLFSTPIAFLLSYTCIFLGKKKKIADFCPASVATSELVFTGKERVGDSKTRDPPMLTSAYRMTWVLWGGCGPSQWPLCPWSRLSPPTLKLRYFAQPRLKLSEKLKEAKAKCKSHTAQKWRKRASSFAGIVPKTDMVM